jgi:hypothetical protein
MAPGGEGSSIPDKEDGAQRLRAMQFITLWGYVYYGQE